MSDTVTTKAAAEACETTPRLLRQFLRASKDYTAVGSGGRYAFEAGDLPTLKTRFVAWVAEREAAQAAREKAAAEAEAAKVAATPAEGDTDADDETDTDDEPEPVKAKPRTAWPQGRRVRITCASCGETFDPEQLTIPAELAELGDDASTYCTVECRDTARD